MVEETYRKIDELLSGTRPEELLRGLALVRTAAAQAGADERRALCERILPLFYIDTFDHPEHAPVLNAAIAVAAEMGEAAIPGLIQGMDAGDIKAQMAMAQALGSMGAPAIGPLLDHYRSACPDPACHAFLLYALGKVKSPEILEAAPLAIEAAASPDLELRDTATRAIGKFVESIPAGGLPGDVRDAFLTRLQERLADDSPSVRAKAVRSLGKLAKFGHLDAGERAQVKVILARILGQDDHFEWDRAYVVRKEAAEGLRYV